MIEVDHLTKKFGAFTAVDDLSFNVMKGEVLGFLGPNGAGKSTTMKMIAGFLTPTSGSARICGFDVGHDPIAVKARIGYLPEGAPAWADMSPIGFLNFIAGIRGLSGKALTMAVDMAVEKTQLSHVLHQPIDTLSKGFKRRVGLAQALLHDPEVLIMDEPTDGLDPNQKHDVRQLIADMAGEKAIIVSTHILEEVEAVCSRAMIIADGKILADGTPAELESRAENHNAVRIHLNDRTDDTAKYLLAMDQVDDVIKLGDNEIMVRPTDAINISSLLAEHLRSNDFAFDELHLLQGRLDDVFRTITRPSASSQHKDASNG